MPALCDCMRPQIPKIKGKCVVVEDNRKGSERVVMKATFHRHNVGVRDESVYLALLVHRIE